MHLFIEKNRHIYFKWAIVLLGTLLWSITMVKSGVVGEYGVGYWGANGHDAIWHIAITNSLSQGTLNMPIFSGEKIKNYHLGFDLLLAGIHKLTNLPVSTLYFQIFPPIAALLIGLFTYQIVLDWRSSETAAWWSTFFVYFGTSLGWILGKGDSIFWAQQSLSTLINPPLALSLIVLLAGLRFLQSKHFIFAGFLLGLLIEIKVYAGILVLFSLLLASLREKNLLKTFVVSMLVSAPLFLFTNSESSHLIIIQPGWFIETLFAPDRLNIPRFFSALNTFRVGKIWIKAVPAFGLGFVVFLIGNIGLRTVSITQLFKKDWLTSFSFGVICLGALIPMVVVQKGTPWNTIQFFYYSLFFLSILAGPSLAIIIQNIKKIPIKLLLCSVVFFSTYREVNATLKNYLPSRPPAKVSTEELSALTTLGAMKKGIILTYPFDKKLADLAQNNPPRPLYLYESTAYVSAFTGMPTFMEDEVNLYITDYDVNGRRQQIENYFHNPSVEFIQKNNIKYIYLTQNQLKKLSTRPSEKQIFSNQEIIIFTTE